MVVVVQLSAMIRIQCFEYLQMSWSTIQRIHYQLEVFLGIVLELDFLFLFW